MLELVTERIPGKHTEAIEVHRPIRSERGAVMGIFAVVLLFIALLVVGFMIVVPTTQSTKIMLQRAVDEAAKHALMNHLYSYDDTLSLAHQQVNHLASATSLGSLSAGILELEVAMPVFQSLQARHFDGAAFSDIANANSWGGPLGSSFGDVFYPSLSGASTNDYRNGISVYAKARPNHFVGIAGELLGQADARTDIEVVSIYRVGTMLTYLLFDPAFTMNEDNYAYMFGVDDNALVNNNFDIWPVRASLPDRGAVADPWANDVAGTPINPQTPWSNWDWPNNYGEVLDFTPTGQDIDPICATNGWVEQHKRFYAAMCDSLPWVNFKEATVRMIEWLSQSSFSSSTTAVGIAGFGVPDSMDSRFFPLIPVFPTEHLPGANGQLIEYHLGHSPSLFDYGLNVGPPATGALLPLGATDFPLQVNAVGTPNEALYLKRQSAFAGFVNSNTPHVMGNLLSLGSDMMIGGAEDPHHFPFGGGGPGAERFDNLEVLTPQGTGLNRWELGFCSALYSQNLPRNPSDFYLQPGTQFNWGGASPDPDPTAIFSYDPADNINGLPKLLRNTKGLSSPHWLDDDLTTPYDVSLTHHQWGNGSPENGETPRNIIAMQAIRVRDPGLDNIQRTGNTPYNDLYDWQVRMETDDLYFEGPGGTFPAVPNKLATPTEWGGVDQTATPNTTDAQCWARPRQPERLDENPTVRNNPPTTPRYEPMAGGWSYLAPSIVTAAQYLASARRDYQSNNDYNRRRPIVTTTLVLNAFAPWNYSTLYRLGMAPSDALQDFLEALARALCEYRVNVVLNFLPLSETNIVAIQDVITDADNGVSRYEAYHQALESGQAATLPPMCDAIDHPPPPGAQSLPIGKVYLMAQDYRASLYDWRINEEGTHWQELKLKSSALYAADTPVAIKNILLQNALSK